MLARASTSVWLMLLARPPESVKGTIFRGYFQRVNLSAGREAWPSASSISAALFGAMHHVYQRLEGKQSASDEGQRDVQRPARSYATKPKARNDRALRLGFKRTGVGLML